MAQSMHIAVEELAERATKIVLQGRFDTTGAVLIEIGRAHV